MLRSAEAVASMGVPPTVAVASLDLVVPDEALVGVHGLPDDFLVVKPLLCGKALSNSWTWPSVMQPMGIVTSKMLSNLL
jgi:hypothetical protein